MPRDAKPARTIVLSGFAGGRGSETAITLVDASATMLQRAPVDEDGRCEVSEAALASAREVVFGPIHLGAPGPQFRGLIDSENTFDVRDLVARPAGDGRAERQFMPPPDLNIYPHPRGGDS